MNDYYYFPCTSSGKLLRGFSPSIGSEEFFKRDCLRWYVFGIKFVCVGSCILSLSKIVK